MGIPLPTPPVAATPPLLIVNAPASLSSPSGGGCSVGDNTLLQIFDQLVADSNAILISRYQMQADSAIWNFLSEEIGLLVKAAGFGLAGPEQRSLIYGQIMLIITSQYLPAVSTFLGDQIGEQAAIQNMSSDISAFIIQAETGFNALSSTPDCSCPTTCTTDGDCPGCTTTCDGTNNYNFYSGVMALVAGTNGSVIAPDTGPGFSFSFTVTLLSQGVVNHTEQNVLGFLTDDTIWGSGNAPLSSSQSSQISTALLGIATVFNPTVSDPTTDGNVEVNAWSTMNLTNIASAICSWTQPYGSGTENTTATPPTGPDEPITTGNAPLVWTQPATVQADLNTAAQTIEGVATSTQTIENFQVQEIDQFYGITNSIQMSQEQQCASMVKQQTT
ncbi:MAG: hypothetical protein V4489_04635 [Chlamydiota bacterium]